MVSSGSKGAKGPCPLPSPVKISHKKDGRQRQSHRFHVSRPRPGRWIRYWEGGGRRGPPPSRSNFFYFHAVFGGFFGQIIGWRPLWEIPDLLRVMDPRFPRPCEGGAPTSERMRGPDISQFLSTKLLHNERNRTDWGGIHTPGALLLDPPLV